MNQKFQKNKNINGGAGLIILIPLILLIIFIVYSGWDHLLGEDLSPNDSTRFFFKKFIRKFLILFSK